MTLTKAELADLLFEKVGFNKREAKDMVETFFEEVRHGLEAGKASSCLDSAISNCASSRSVLAVTRKPAKKFRSPRAALLPSTPRKS